MIIQDLKIDYKLGNGVDEFRVSLTVRHSEVQADEFEGVGDTLALAMFDIGDQLQEAGI